MRGKLGDEIRLTHILESINEIENYVRGIDFSEFRSNSMVKFASIKQLEIIGEAAKHLTDSTKEKYKTISWNEIIGLRNILVHEYFGVDAELVWQIIKTDIPVLKQSLTSS